VCWRHTASSSGDLRSTPCDFCSPLDTQYLTARTAIEALGLGFFSDRSGAGADDHVRRLQQRERGPDARGDHLGRRRHCDLAAGRAAVFTIVFAHGLDPAGGPGLVFITLPLAFARMPFGWGAAIAFYVLCSCRAGLAHFDAGAALR